MAAADERRGAHDDDGIKGAGEVVADEEQQAQHDEEDAPAEDQGGEEDADENEDEEEDETDEEDDEEQAHEEAEEDESREDTHGAHATEAALASSDDTVGVIIRAIMKTRRCSEKSAWQMYEALSTAW